MSPKTVLWVCAALLASATLSACGISTDNAPRDIDPAKQEILEAPTTLP